MRFPFVDIIYPIRLVRQDPLKTLHVQLTITEIRRYIMHILYDRVIYKNL